MMNKLIGINSTKQASGYIKYGLNYSTQIKKKLLQFLKTIVLKKVTNYTRVYNYKCLYTHAMVITVVKSLKLLQN